MGALPADGGEKETDFFGLGAGGAGCGEGKGYELQTVSPGCLTERVAR